MHFLNIQLSDCDRSAFCDPVFAQDLPGFKQFVVKSMIQMSRDFATRSLQLSEESPSLAAQHTDENADIAQFQLKRRWESRYGTTYMYMYGMLLFQAFSAFYALVTCIRGICKCYSPHPYVFFNADRNSMTFLGFNIGGGGEMVDTQTGRILERNVMTRHLSQALVRNHVPLNENFDTLHRFICCLIIPDIFVLSIFRFNQIYIKSVFMKVKVKVVFPVSDTRKSTRFTG